MGNYLQLESGVLVPNQPAEHAAFKRALKQHDPHLSVGQVNGVWKVYVQASAELPPEFLCDWRDRDGTPLDLSFGLLDKVKSLDRNSRVRQESAEDLDRRRSEELSKHKQDVAEALVDDYKGARPILPRSQSLRRARSKSGYHDWKV